MDLAIGQVGELSSPTGLSPRDETTLVTRRNALWSSPPIAPPCRRNKDVVGPVDLTKTVLDSHQAGSGCILEETNQPIASNASIAMMP